MMMAEILAVLCKFASFGTDCVLFSDSLSIRHGRDFMIAVRASPRPALFGSVAAQHSCCGSADPARPLFPLPVARQAHAHLRGQLSSLAPTSGGRVTKRVYVSRRGIPAWARVFDKRRAHAGLSSSARAGLDHSRIVASFAKTSSMTAAGALSILRPLRARMSMVRG